MSPVPDPETTDAEELDAIDVEYTEAPSAIVQIETDLATLKADIKAQLERSQAMVEFQATMRNLVAAQARPNHWVRFGDRIKPDGSECLRLRMLFGVTFEVTDGPTRQDHEDEGGKYYLYMTHGRASLGPVTVPCFGVASSRARFFAVKNGEYVDPRDINPAYLCKMSYMECLKHGIVTLFGLDIDPDELQGITGRTPGDTTQKFNRNAPRDQMDSTETKEMRAWLGNRILELASGDMDASKQFLISLTTFKGRDGKWIKGRESCRALTDKQVANLYKWRDKNLTPQAFAEFITQQKGA